jgi:ribosomal protein S18 acetylase RimI-like enzyme
MRQNTWIKVGVVAVVLAIASGTGYYFISQERTIDSIYTFVEQRDMPDMAKMFKDDWYLLSVNKYDAERIRWQMVSGSPNEWEPEYFGKMKVRVLRQDNRVVGFVTYYMKNIFEGDVLFLCVASDYRGKRFGEKLMRYAIGDLFKQGARFVTLVTRPVDTSARKLYKRVGFKELWEDETFVHLRLDKP